ncbi:hypothetical protein [Bacillus sp. BP-3]|uniref:hypothetical protein n=1 Tax=Bacillus sp. BP-3 TaxID=3022773 RepID=UPI00232BB962|nr:hypothetical protein [Bacillus sp. BP-3]MDC2866524.1 hypothetical protein [Bacillus sp. BP-3]
MEQKKYKVTFKDGKSEVVTGRVFLFDENKLDRHQLLNGLNLYNASCILSVKEIEETKECEQVETVYADNKEVYKNCKYGKCITIQENKKE